MRTVNHRPCQPRGAGDSWLPPRRRPPSTRATSIQGKRVISALDVDDLEPGKKHSFFFQGVQMGTGQHWYLPVVVAKGAKPGKKILLISGVHGDEVSPVDAVQRTMAALDPAQMSGTVTAVFDVSRPAKEGVTRMWPIAQWGGQLIDLNRVWPGNEEGGNAPMRHAGLVFNRLFKPNADYALDYHTAATGGDFTAFIFAKMGKPEIRAMAELFPIEQIKNDPGFPGTLETSLVEAGIPALTIEIGGPRSYDRRMIPLFVEGGLNVLKLHGVIPGPMGRTAKDAGTFYGDAFHTVRATHGGFLELLVDLTRHGRRGAEGRDPAQLVRRGRQGIRERGRGPGRDHPARRHDRTWHSRRADSPRQPGSEVRR